MLIDWGVSCAIVEQMSSLMIRPRVLCNQQVVQQNATSSLQPGCISCFSESGLQGSLLFYFNLPIFVVDFQAQIKCRLVFHCEIWHRMQ